MVLIKETSSEVVRFGLTPDDLSGWLEPESRAVANREVFSVAPKPVCGMSCQDEKASLEREGNLENAEGQRDKEEELDRARGGRVTSWG